MFGAPPLGQGWTNPTYKRKLHIVYRAHVVADDTLVHFYHHAPACREWVHLGALEKRSVLAARVFQRHALLDTLASILSTLTASPRMTPTCRDCIFDCPVLGALWEHSGGRDGI